MWPVCPQFQYVGVVVAGRAIWSDDTHRGGRMAGRDGLNAPASGRTVLDVGCADRCSFREGVCRYAHGHVFDCFGVRVDALQHVFTEGSCRIHVFRGLFFRTPSSLLRCRMAGNRCALWSEALCQLFRQFVVAQRR
ncbi:uncharacterized protein LOC143916707 [Arctopsyche grandis]|uniref:uncharacterized protein LOC143916707 n=1 Tax=Arctopsyche grandis TaxID=121162 RepID=UPI00406D81E9